ncbi:MAG: hypothetical protein V3V33_12625 [Candidatus Lokiarchaeia archaeon]
MNIIWIEVLWDDDQLKLIRFQHTPRDSFEKLPTRQTETEFEFVKAGDAVLIDAY